MREYPLIAGWFISWKITMFPWEDLGGIFPRLHLPWPLGGKKLSPRTPPAVPRSERSWEIPQTSQENHGTAIEKPWEILNYGRFDALVRWEHPLSKWWDLDWLVGARPTWSLFFVRSRWCEKPRIAISIFSETLQIKSSI